MQDTHDEQVIVETASAEGYRMTVSTALGERVVTRGDRLRHVNYPDRTGVVELVAPNSLLLTLDSGETWSGTSRVWEPLEETDSPAASERRKILAAAAALEDIEVMLKAAVIDMRSSARSLNRPTVDSVAAARLRQDAYARLFTVRRKLGRVVASLGAGTPARLSQIEAELDQLVND